MQKSIKHYLRLIAFSHTVFAMPFAVLGFFLGVKDRLAASGGKLESWVSFGFFDTAFPFFRLFLLVLGCMVFARSAAMAFNRYLDRAYDARNPRTAGREIPRGWISPRAALFFTGINALLFVVCTFFINSLCFYLSPVALVVILGYSYTKRFSSLCHLVLGLGLALAPVGAYLAVTGYFAELPIVFAGVVFFWVAGFDIIYSLQDEEFDRSQGLLSIPVWLGKKRALIFSRFLHGLCGFWVLYAGARAGLGLLYWVGALIFIAMLIYQHRLVKPHDLRRVNIAFMTANGVASVFFALFLLADLFIKL